MHRTTGTYERTSVAGEEVAAFIPLPLPPRDPPLDLGPDLRGLLTAAEQALARLDLVGAMIPSIDWFLYAFVRQEAVLSSQIEGTQATLVDLLTFEAEEQERPDDPDLAEVCNYLEAIDHALDQLRRPDGLPLSVRLLNDTHRELMRGVRGEGKMPGEVRRSQNWIGGTRPGNAAFVPPPPHRLAECLSELERFIHGEADLPALVRIGLVHAQFETLHPYLDGNGRLGRLLITLLLEHWGMLGRPLLYLSHFFKAHQRLYYDRLSAIRVTGDWEGWLAFFLEGIAVVASSAVETAQRLFALVTTDRARVLASPAATVLALRLFEMLPEHPILSIGRAMGMLEASRPAATKAIGVLEGVGVLVEGSGKRRDRSWGYRSYLASLALDGQHEES